MLFIGIAGYTKLHNPAAEHIFCNPLKLLCGSFNVHIISLHYFDPGIFPDFKIVTACVRNLSAANRKPAAVMNPFSVSGPIGRERES